MLNIWLALPLTDNGVGQYSTRGMDNLVAALKCGFSPHLEGLYLCGIPFPGLPKLLLSATLLVELHLYGIPLPGTFYPTRWTPPFLH